MSDNQFSSITPKLDEVIDTALDRLTSFDEESEDYSKTLTQVERLAKVRISLTPAPPAPEEKKKRDRSWIEPWIPAIASLAGIAAVGILEIKGHSMASKASAFIPKMK